MCVDIDTIEIRSDDDDSEEPGGIKTRRVYHYRVSSAEIGWYMGDQYLMSGLAM